MHYVTIPVTPFLQNCSLIWCEQTMRGAFVDPGGNAPLLIKKATEHGVAIEKVILTHGHLDHVGGAVDVARHYGVPIEGPHLGDKDWLSGLPLQSQQFGLPEVKPFTPDQWLSCGDTVTVGAMTLQVRHCPGHTPGHVIFYDQPTKRAFVGDVLFKGSIGRTDFPRGNYDDLVRSIREKLWPLGNDVTFVPGHGPESTFGEERRSNLFVADQVAA